MQQWHGKDVYVVFWWKSQTTYNVQIALMPKDNAYLAMTATGIFPFNFWGGLECSTHIFYSISV